jgi:hypothetical protein
MGGDKFERSHSTRNRGRRAQVKCKGGKVEDDNQKGGNGANAIKSSPSVVKVGRRHS